MPFDYTDDGDDLPFTRREAVDAGTDVIDLAKMRDELEEARRKRLEGS